MKSQFVLLVALLAAVVVGCEGEKVDACDRLGVATGFVLGTNQVVVQNFAPVAVLPQRVVFQQAVPVLSAGVSFGFNQVVASNVVLQSRVCGPLGVACLTRNRVLSQQILVQQPRRSRRLSVNIGF